MLLALLQAWPRRYIAWVEVDPDGQDNDRQWYCDEPCTVVSVEGMN